MTALLPVIAGFAAGAAGAMGLGGGFVLILYLNFIGMNVSDIRAANLLFFIPTALVSMLMNRKSGLIDRSVLPYAAAAGSVGAVLGLMLGEAIDAGALRFLFGAIITAVGAKELFHRKDERKPDKTKARMP